MTRLRTVVRVVRSASAHRVPPMAGEAAFFAALAVFPTLLTVVAVVRAGAVVLGPGADAQAAAGLTGVLRVVLTTRGGTAADAAAELLTGSTGGLLTAGSVVALFLLARALRSVLHALGVVAGRERARLWPAAVALAIGTLLGAAVVLAVAVADPLRVLAVPGAEAIWSVLRWPLAALALLGWAMVLLRVGLGRRHGSRGRRGLVLGAVVATLGWFAASLLFPLYVTIATRFTDTIGALGGGLILLLWLYLLMLVLYLGAEVCVAVAHPG